MTIKLNDFATDWEGMLRAYSSNTSFHCSSGKVVKVNNRYKIILSEPCREVFKLNKPVLTWGGISNICEKLSIKSDQIEVLEKISQSFDSISTQLKQRLAAEPLPSKFISVRFSKWFSHLAWNRPLLTKILIVATFGIFYFIWKRGSKIEQRYDKLSSDAGFCNWCSQKIKENINDKKTRANLVHSINANKESLPLPVMGIIFNYLKTWERDDLIKGWDVARDVMHVSRQFQMELIQKYQKLLSPLKDTFKTEMQPVMDLEEYFKWNPIPIESDYSDTEERIRLAIFSFFGANRDDISSLRSAMNFTYKAILEKFKKYLQYKEFAILFAQTTSSSTVLEYMPKDMKGCREVVLEVVKKNGCALEFASEDLKKDKEVVLKAMGSNGYALKYASEDLKNDKEVVLEAIKSNIYALQWASPELKKDLDVVTGVLDDSNYRHRYISFYEHADLSVLKNRGVLLKAVSLDDKGDLLSTKTVPEEFKKDKEIVYAAVGRCGKAMQFVAEEFRKDTDLILLGLKSSDEALYYAVDELKKNREFIVKAISVNGYALRWAPEEFRHDPEMVMKGLENDDRAFACTSDVLKKDRDFVQKAVQKHKYAIRFASEEIPDYKQMVLEVLEKEPRVFEFLPKKLNENGDFAIEAIKKNYKVYDHFSWYLKHDTKVWKAYYER